MKNAGIDNSEKGGAEELWQALSALLGLPLEPGKFLHLAVKISAALAALYEQNIIHRSINPHTILVNSQTGDVTLTGFSTASRLGEEYTPVESRQKIEGTPEYISPEQTGRMNRPVDHRSDLYSLGVVFYEMLTGRLPFQAEDVLGWVYCHIACSPRPPAEVLPETPSMLSAIVMKLLMKNAEERYQTASGLEADLKKCLTQWETRKEIEQFALGEEDISDRLLIPQKLYGRERDIETLMNAFNRVVERGTPELIMVAGYSGIGKTSLIRELYKPVVRERGFFISGKFDQFKRNIPYATVAEAFRELVQQILTESEERVADWKRRLQAALGVNGRIIIEVIPHVELIIGKQPPVPELPPIEAQNRFNMVFRQFVNVFAKKEHPLVIFLDDLQWVDSASLKLLEYIITHPDSKYLLPIGAYRDNEVSASHSLMLTLDDIRGNGAIVQTITLSPLSIADLGRLMADTSRSSQGRVEPLTGLIYEKTAGNPFFVTQFLKTLYDEGLVKFERTERFWKWDIVRIREKDYTDNVVDLMVGKLKKLSGRTLQEMRLAACIGNKFDFDTLTVISSVPDEETRESLGEAVREGLLLRRNDTYLFLHDRIQEAAYSLVTEEQRAGLHLRIGRLMVSQLSKEAIEEHVFDVVNQLNHGMALIASGEERERVAELNLVAAKRAKASTAYASALQYLTAGRALLAEDSWDRRYDLIFALELHRAECEYLTGELMAAEERLAMLARRAGNIADASAVACAQVALYTTMDRSDRGVEACLEYLRRLGIQWSPHPTGEDVGAEYERMWRHLGSRPIEELIDLPPMTDPDWGATLDVLTWASSPALFTDYHLFCLIAGRMVNLSLEHGNSDASCFGYVRLGMVLGPHFGDYRAGFRFGKLGFDLLEKRGVLRFKARTYLDFGHLINPWTRHLRTGIELLRRGFDAAQETGDLTYACYICNCLITLLLAAGDPLADVEQEAERALGFVRKAKFGLVVDIITGQLRLMRTLRGLTPDFSSFNDVEFDEERFEQHLEGDPRLAIATCWYWIRKLQARFYAGDYASAIEAAAKAQGLLWTSPAFFEVAEYHFYDALARTAHYDAVPAEERPQHLQALVAHHEQLKIWAENCPENFGNRAALVGAEIARLGGRNEEAMELFEQAIRSARENGFVQVEAIAFELASKFYRARGFDHFGNTYLRQARACYARWGADGKVKQLDEQYPWLQEEERAAAAKGMSAEISRVDAITVSRASQAISGEIVLSNLLDTLMRIMIENGGAQKGYLILARGDALSVEAQASVEGDEIKVLQKPPYTLSEVLPLSMINYVRRTRQSVILDDASGHTVFSSDEYIKQNKPVSVLCLPVLRQANLIGLLYLENNLVKGAFTADRIAVLEVLASQAAISLENAGLYLEQSRAEDELRKLNRTLSMISKCNQAAIRARDEISLLRDVCRIIVDVGGYYMAWAGFAEHDEEKTVRPAAFAGHEDGYFKSVKITWADTELGRGPTGRAIRTGKPAFAENILTDAIYGPWRAEAARRNYRSSIAVPLISNGQTLGALSLYAERPSAFDPEEVKLLTELAGDLAYGIVSLRTREERTQAEETIKYQAYHDLLTGLPNRALFVDLLNHEIHQMQRSRKKLAVLFLDIDHFKNINDSLGHSAGDQLIRDTAVRLRISVREFDTIARIGADEFSIMLPFVTRPEDATRTAEKIMAAFKDSFIINGHELSVTASTGISMYPEDGEHAETLLKNAEIAMFHAKKLGRNNFQFYNPAINIRTLERILLSSRLRQAAERGELVVYYQPQIQIRTGRIVGAEALVRWNHPELGLLQPMQFIPLAEEIGLIIQLDQWVLRSACEQLKAWEAAGLGPHYITTNLSARQFQQPDLPKIISDVLKETELNPERLGIEITETVAMQDTELTARNVSSLNALGVRFLIDDFGTGYSSLSYLKKLPIHKLKIDQSFITNLGKDRDYQAIINAIIAMAHILKVKVVAEGVETEDQMSFLNSRDCDEMQGYLSSKPVPAGEFEELVSASS